MGIPWVFYVSWYRGNIEYLHKTFYYKSKNQSAIHILSSALQIHIGLQSQYVTTGISLRQNNNCTYTMQWKKEDRISIISVSPLIKLLSWWPRKFHHYLPGISTFPKIDNLRHPCDAWSKTRRNLSWLLQQTRFPSIKQVTLQQIWWSPLLLRPNDRSPSCIVRA